jgi:Zn-finger nucleic acid-binding protein
MEYRYDLTDNYLCIGESRISAYDLEENEIGSCSNCSAMLVSLSYHSVSETNVVVTRCVSCRAFYANVYDLEWSWIDEVPLSLLPIPITISNQVINDSKELEKLSIKKLQAVFSRGEIEALFARTRNETPIRQYLYRARKKYKLFEEIFDIRLEL